MIKKVIFILFLFVCPFSMSQKLTTTLVNSTPLAADSFLGIDTMGNYYFIKDNVFTKKNASQTWQYKNVALGKITSVDILNPLKIIIFYENFNTTVLLDAQLNEILQKNFSIALKETLVSHVGLASNNRLWLYNNLTNSIELYDYTTNASQTVGQPLTQKIVYAQTNFNTFYWIDEMNNLYTCDVFGKVTLMCNVPAYEKIQIIDGERLLFSTNNKLYLLNNTLKSIIEIEIVENSFENFYCKDQNLAIFTNQQISNYKIILP